MESCPTRDQLHKFSRKLLTDRERSTIKEHLSECSDCREKVDPSAETMSDQSPTMAAHDQPATMTYEADSGERIHSEYQPDLADRIASEFNSARQAPEDLNLDNALSRGKQIGAGGLGEVHEYHDEALARDVAVKLIRADRGSGPDRRERFEREYRITSQLEHPGVVPVYGIGKTPTGQPFYAMRYVRGETLKARIRDFHTAGGELSRENKEFRKLLESFKTICETVGHAHSRNIWHRDLKPENIVVKDDVTTVLDWGIAKHADEADDLDTSPQDAGLLQTIDGHALGSPPYMPPEQAAGDIDAIDHRSDIYGLGAILFELLTNKPPHRLSDDEFLDNQSERIKMLLAKIEDEPTPQARDALSTVPAELNSICARAMARERHDRYQAATNVGEDIDQWLVQGEVTAHKYTWRERLALKLRRRIRLVVTGVAMLAILLVAAVVGAGVVNGFRTEEQRQRKITEEALELTQAFEVRASNRASRLELEAGELGYGPGSGAHGDTFESRVLAFAKMQKPVRLSGIGEGNFGVLSMAMDTARDRLVSTHGDGRALVWDVEDGVVTKSLLSGRYNEEMRYWFHHLTNREEGLTLEDKGECWVSVTWLGDTDRIAAASTDGQGVVVDVASGERTVVVESARALLAVAATSDGKRLLFGSAAGAVFLVDDEEVTQVEANDDAVVSVARLPKKGWTVGRESGLVQLFDEQLKELSTVKLDGPIWSIGSIESQIAVGNAKGAAVLQVGDNSELSSLHQPISPGRGVAVQSIRFSKDGSRVYALDDFGSLSWWEPGSVQESWSHWIIGGNANADQLQKAIAEAPLEQVPRAFRRHSTAIINMTDDSVAVAGSDATISMWELPAATGRANQTLQTELGQNPKIAFAHEHPDLLWALDEEGVLTLFDAKNDKPLDTKNAHSGGKVNLDVIQGTDIVATVCGDNEVRFWRAEKNKIRAGKPKRLKHKHPLISVAVSSDGRWVGSVDEKGILVVWLRETGEMIFTDQLAGANGMELLTGCLSFDPTNQYLVVAGRGQTAFVFKCNSKTDGFRRIPDQLRVAGNGGTALTWNPVFPHEVIMTDDYPRVFSRRFGDQTHRFLNRTSRQLHGQDVFRHNTLAQDYVAIKQTGDDQRIVFAGREGQIAFDHSKFAMRMLVLQSGIAPINDIAIDDEDRWMLVAAEDGRLERWNSTFRESVDRPKVEDETDEWSTKSLLPESPIVVQIDERAVGLDAEGRVNLLIIEQNSTDLERDGALFFIGEGDEAMIREPIVLGQQEFNRRMTFEAMGMEFTPGGQPVIAFRRRHGEATSYDGSFHLGHRVAPGQWEYETVHQHGNLGFSPKIVMNDAGDVTDIMHFAFGGYYLLQSRPMDDANAEEWGVRYLGRQGDGMKLSARQDQQGRVHMMFQPNRHNSDASRPLYARWDGGDELAIRVPSDSSSYSDFEVLPDGRPVTRRGGQLVRRDDKGWVVHQTLPETDFAPIRTFGIDREGVSYWLGWRDDENALVLWRGKGDDWQGAIIAKDWEQAPEWCTIRFDAANQPVIIASRRGWPYSWVYVLRKE